MSLKTIREALAQFVTDVIDVDVCHAYPAGHLPADQAAIVPATPYLQGTEDTPFCRSGLWAYDIYIATSAQDIEAAARWLDVQMETLVLALHDDERNLSEKVGQPVFVDLDRGGDVGRTKDESLFLAIIPLRPLEACP